MSKTQNVFTNLQNAGKISILKDWNLSTYPSFLDLPADIPSLNADGNPTFQLALAEDTGIVYKWQGGTVMAWVTLSKDEEVILNVDAPPIDSWDGPDLIVGSYPTGMTANTKLITWLDVSSGKQHLYQVESPAMTPSDPGAMNTVFREITVNQLIRVETAETNDTLLDLDPLRPHTIYFNTTTGEEWLIDEFGDITILTGAYQDGVIEFVPFPLIAGTPTVLDINVDSNIAAQGGSASGISAEEALTANILVNGISVQDADNLNQLNTNSYSVVPVSTSTFEITANIDCNVIVVFQGLLKKAII